MTSYTRAKTGQNLLKKWVTLRSHFHSSLSIKMQTKLAAKTIKHCFRTKLRSQFKVEILLNTKPFLVLKLRPQMLKNQLLLVGQAQLTNSSSLTYSRNLRKVESQHSLTPSPQRSVCHSKPIKRLKMSSRSSMLSQTATILNEKREKNTMLTASNKNI